jgi:hypothetical protein
MSWVSMMRLGETRRRTRTRTWASIGLGGRGDGGRGKWDQVGLLLRSVSSGRVSHLWVSEGEFKMGQQ